MAAVKYRIKRQSGMTDAAWKRAQEHNERAALYHKMHHAINKAAKWLLLEEAEDATDEEVADFWRELDGYRDLTDKLGLAVRVCYEMHSEHLKGESDGTG